MRKYLHLLNSYILMGTSSFYLIDFLLFTKKIPNSASENLALINITKNRRKVPFLLTLRALYINTVSVKIYCRDFLPVCTLPFLFYLFSYQLFFLQFSSYPPLCLWSFKSYLRRSFSFQVYKCSLNIKSRFWEGVSKAWDLWKKKSLKKVLTAWEKQGR